MKNVLLLFFATLLSLPAHAQLSYELNLIRPDRQINHAIWKNQNSLSSVTTTIKRSKLGRIRDFLFYENDQQKYNFKRGIGKFILRDSISGQQISYNPPNASKAHRKKIVEPDGKYILPDGSKITRWREEFWEPSMVIELTNEFDALIAVAYYATDPPKTTRKLIVKIVKPTEHAELLLAMLTFDLLRSYRSYYRAMAARYGLDPDW
ncbi:MAG TPA: hypothetical protein VJ953_04680 [Saprospiraceae bacterium]|nr:hypothetical protein [Saprospiraceae bacterium]